MFEQTFVEAGHNGARKPYTIGMSLVLQVIALSILALIPLVYTQVLPNAQLKSLLSAPAPPRAAPRPTPVVQSRSSNVTHVFNKSVLVAPRAIPQKIVAVDPSAPPPDIGVNGGVTGSDNNTADRVIGSALSATPAYTPPEPAFKPAPRKTSVIRVGSVLAQANLIHRVQPSYPALAKSARVQGTVEFSAVISKDGLIENLQLRRGHPLLVNAAREAVLQWRYRPTLLNGEPVEVVTDIIVNFTLAP